MYLFSVTPSQSVAYGWHDDEHDGSGYGDGGGPSPNDSYAYGKPLGDVEVGREFGAGNAAVSCADVIIR